MHDKSMLWSHLRASLLETAFTRKVSEKQRNQLYDVVKHTIGTTGQLEPVGSSLLCGAASSSALALASAALPGVAERGSLLAEWN